MGLQSDAGPEGVIDFWTSLFLDIKIKDNDAQKWLDESAEPASNQTFFRIKIYTSSWTGSVLSVHALAQTSATERVTNTPFVQAEESVTAHRNVFVFINQKCFFRIKASTVFDLILETEAVLTNIFSFVPGTNFDETEPC